MKSFEIYFLLLGIDPKLLIFSAAFKPAAKKSGPTKVGATKKVDGPSQNKKVEAEDVEVSYLHKHSHTLCTCTYIYSMLIISP